MVQNNSNRSTLAQMVNSLNCQKLSSGLCENARHQKTHKWELLLKIRRQRHSYHNCLRAQKAPCPSPEAKPTSGSLAGRLAATEGAARARQRRPTAGVRPSCDQCASQHWLLFIPSPVSDGRSPTRKPAIYHYQFAPGKACVGMCHF